MHRILPPYRLDLLLVFHHFRDLLLPHGDAKVLRSQREGIQRRSAEFHMRGSGSIRLDLVMILSIYLFLFVLALLREC